MSAKYGVQVVGLEWTDSDGSGKWQLKDKNGESLGMFNAVVVADKGLASSRFSAQTGLPPPLGTNIQTRVPVPRKFLGLYSRSRS